MEITTIEVEPRTATGSRQVARLRRDGKVPAVLYGGGGGVQPLSVSEHQLVQHVRHHHRVFRLATEDRQAVYLQEVQWDVLTDRPLHVDFLRIDLQESMRVNVELEFLGHPVGLSKGGRLVRDLAEVPVTCLPAAIPESIPVPVDALDLGDRIVAGQLQLPPGVVLDLPADTSIAHVSGEVAEAPAPEAAAEGGPAEGGGAS
jgi:large subunit ribosomal protein L25